MNRINTQIRQYNKAKREKLEKEKNIRNEKNSSEWYNTERNQKYYTSLPK